MLSKRLVPIKTTHNEKVTTCLSDGEIAFHSEGLTETPIVPLGGKDMVKVDFEKASIISGLLFETGVGTPAIA